MLRDIRKQYAFAALDEKDVEKNPLNQFKIWLEVALKSDEEEPTAMIISTVDEKLQPHARVVLLKDFIAEGLVFYTNYEGNKATQLTQNNRISVLFFWQSLERQIRITGTVEKVPDEVSKEYFLSRPIDSRLGAWASDQSKVIPSAEYLNERYEHFKIKFGEKVPRPEHWGGYLIRPETFEFWQGRPNRLHDRIYYSPQLDGKWKIERLSP